MRRDVKIHALVTTPVVMALMACGGAEADRLDGDAPAESEVMAASASASDLKTIVMTVPGMSCPLCVRSIERRLEEAGLQGIRIDLDTKLVRARFDPARTTVSEVEALVEGQGFTVAESRILRDERGEEGGGR